MKINCKVIEHLHKNKATLKIVAVGNRSHVTKEMWRVRDQVSVRTFQFLRDAPDVISGHWL